MRLIRILGGILIFLSLITFIGDAYQWLAYDLWAPKALGRLWSEWNPATLQLLQPAIERHLWAPLWSEIVFPILRQPATLVFLIFGILLRILGRKREKRRYR